MPIKMGDQTYSKFEDASKSVQQSKGLPKERADAYVATIDRKQQGKEDTSNYEVDVDELIKTGEPTQKLPKDKRSYDVQAEMPEEVQPLTTPRADNVKTEDTQDLTSPQGSSREVSQDSDIKKANAYGKLNGGKSTDNEDENKDERREGHQSLEYNGSTYHKVESLEYDGKIYIPRKATEEYGECPEGEVWNAELELCEDESITQPGQYNKKATEENPNHADDGKFASGSGGSSGLSDSHKQALDKYIEKHGKEDSNAIYSLAGWDKDMFLPPAILKQVKDVSDDDILEYVKSKTGEAKDNDLEYDNKIWKQADEDVLELDNDHYVKDAKEEGDMIPNPQSSMPQPTTTMNTPELTPTAESIIIKESNGKYKKYNIFEVNEDDKKVDAIQSPAKVQDVVPIETPEENKDIVNQIPKIESPQGNITKQEDEKQPVEEMVAIERIIIKESGKLKFKTVFTESKKKALENNEVGNCDFCKGTGKVTVEHLGLKDCPRCGGDGNMEGMQQPSNQPQGQPNQIQGQQPPVSSPPLNQQQPAQQPTTQAQEPPKKENPFTKKEEPKKDNPFEKKENPFEKKSLECQVCPKSVKQFEGWVQRKIDVLKSRSSAHEGVGLLFGLPSIEQKGKKIKGTLAYAGVSLNNRIYLPEELAKGHGRTLPLLLNHSSVAGAEEELDRLNEDMRDHLTNGKDYQIGWVTLKWVAEELTLYYEGVINDKFFQNEVDDAEMAVSLGIWYDSDSPQVCNQECYTLIKGAEFREVSLVYHPGFPIATIEAVEANLKKRARQQITTESAPTLTWTSTIPQFNTTTSTTGITFFTSGNEVDKKKA